ncbi:MAG: hypothetical protein ABI577_04475 [bacterium]
MKRPISTGSEARRRVDRLRALRGSPGPLREHCLAILADEGSPDVIRLALEAIGETIEMGDRPILLSLYDYFDAVGPKADPVGTVRVEVLKLLWHLRSHQDLNLALRASRTVEPGFNSNGELIRAAGIALLGAIDPATAALAAAKILGSGDANTFNGEPSLTAIRLLASLNERAALLMFALNPPAEPGELRAESIRSLANIPIEYIADLIASASASQDEAVLVGLADLVIQLPESPEATEAAKSLLRDAPHPEIYEFLVTSITASRRADLIGVLLETLPQEMSQKRLTAAMRALELAPRTSEVEAAIAELALRVAKQQPPRRP